MYRDDSFFTLDIWQAAGLLVATLVLAVGLLALVRRYCRGEAWRRVLRALVLYWLFLWLSPQAYYGYYMLIFDGLPLQFVIGWPPGLEEVFRRLTFTGPATLAAHGQGVLGWAVAVVAVRRRLW
jgi:hypothetical protein